MPMPFANSTTARTVAWEFLSDSTSRTKLPSILTLATCRVFKFVNEFAPVPKSSMASWHPRVPQARHQLLRSTPDW